MAEMIQFGVVVCDAL